MASSCNPLKSLSAKNYAILHAPPKPILRVVKAQTGDGTALQMRADMITAMRVCVSSSPYTIRMALARSKYSQSMKIGG